MSYEIKRLDHLGVVAGTINELNIIDRIDEIIGRDKREDVSTGECISAMIINGLGFTNQPVSLTEKFFSQKPLELLFGKTDLDSSNFNRFKLSKSLDKVYASGCENLFYQLSLEACNVSNIDTSFSSLDTTSVSVTGEYDTDSDEHAIELKHGFSKDHRPDLKQCMHELLVSQDGGVPLMMKTWSGNSSDSTIFRERASKLINDFKDYTLPKYLIADSKLYSSKNSENLKVLKYITRIPSSIKEINQLIDNGFANNTWSTLSSSEEYITESIEHYGIIQRWIIVKSNQAANRARKRIKKSVDNEYSEYNKKLKEFSKYSFSSKEDAFNNLRLFLNKMKYHVLDTYDILTLDEDNKQQYSILGKICSVKEIQDIKIKQASCYVVGTNIPKEELSDIEIVARYKQQNIAIENTGFRFLKDPKFFAQSMFIKKPERIEALLFVMTLALLIYSIAQRKIRKEMEAQKETIPDQIKKPTSNPTLRWVFQLLSDINILYHKVDGKISRIIEGMSELKTKIINFFGPRVQKIYEKNVCYLT